MRSALALVFLSTLLAAQIPDADWNALLQQRREAGEDLIELRFRRDDHGVLEVRSCEGGAIPFRPMLPIDAPFSQSTYASRASALLLLFAHGPQGLLGNTDAERHLRRAGIEPGAVALRQFLLTPISTVDPVLARVELLDRLVAIEWLQQGKHEGAVAELTALSKRADTPPLLQKRAEVALAAFHRRPAPARQRLAPENLLLPVTADAYVVLDHALLPDFTPMTAIARRVAIDRSYRVVEALKAPTPDDLYWGQYLADLTGEFPFEVVRRYGSMRLDHTVAAIVLQDLGRSLGWNVQTAGEFEPEQFAASMAELAGFMQTEIPVARQGDEVHAVTREGDVAIGASSLRTWSKGMAGRAKPELARELLAEGPAIRVVVPPTSKAWLLLAALELPAGRAEITVSFGEESRLCLSFTARDEDEAAACAERLTRLQAEQLERLRAWTEVQKGTAELQPVLDAIAAAKVTTDGARVDAVLTSKTIGWPAFEALRKTMR